MITRTTLLAVLVFAVSLVQGLVAPLAVAKDLVGQVGQILTPLANLHPFTLLLLVFVNNAAKAFLIIVLGLGVGLIPLAFIAVNGYVLGVVVQVGVAEQGIGIVMMSLVPHGIIELAAVVTAGALGMGVGWKVLLRLFRKNSQVGLRLGQALAAYVRWIAPALAVAALVEVFLTPVLVRLLFR